MGVLALLSALDHAGLFGARGDDRLRYSDAKATVIRAADGDTIYIDISDRRSSKTRVRLWGVDCPEIAHGAAEADAYYGPEAAAFVRKHVVGHRVRVVLDPNRGVRDKFGRLLAYVYLEDTGEMLNETLLNRGLAYADRRFDHVMKHRFGRLEKKAAKAKVGLWADVLPEQMPHWRQRLNAGTEE